MTALLACQIGTSAYAERLPHRLAIPTFVVTYDPAAKADLNTWVALLNSEFTDLISGYVSQLSDGGRVEFVPYQTQQPPSLALMADRWRTEYAIQVISAVGSRQGGATYLSGQIYLGDLGPGIPSKMIKLPVTLNASSYALSRDVVRAATLYALSVDAGASRPVACALVTRANQIRADLQRRKLQIGDLGTAIDQRLASLTCRIKR